MADKYLMARKLGRRISVLYELVETRTLNIAVVVFFRSGSPTWGKIIVANSRGPITQSDGIPELHLSVCPWPIAFT